MTYVPVIRKKQIKLLICRDTFGTKGGTGMHIKILPVNQSTSK